MIELLQALILGVVQGLTEFLPISSSAHLILVRQVVGGPEPPLAFDLALHLGTLVAVLSYFWRDLLGMALALPCGLLAGRPLADPRSRLALYIIVGCLPVGLVGLLFGDVIEATFHTTAGARASLVIIAVAMIALALLLWLAERLAAHHREIKDLTPRDTIIIGLAQALALVPGVSRSGSTITAGLFVGLARPAAARYSFLLGAPVTLLAGLVEIGRVVRAGFPPDQLLPFLVGTVSSAVVGYFCIKYLLRYLQSRTTAIFIVYRLVLGVVVLIVALAR
jgi:undecaprenyl-diphosphatase